MKKIIVDCMQPPMSIPIGRNGEHLVTQVVFDCSKFAEIYGDGIAKLVRKSEKSDTLYPIEITQNGSLAVWIITEADTASVGEEHAELRWYVEESLAKSVQFRFHVTPSITSSTSRNKKALPLPQPTKVWTEHFEKTVASLEARVRQAEMVAQSVRDDASDRKFDGITPDIQIGEITTLPPDQPAAVMIKGTAERPIISFCIPQGRQGDKGDTGATYTPLSVRKDHETTILWHNDKGMPNPDPAKIIHGVSPSVSVTETSTGHQINITDAAGTHAFAVIDGKDGKTPVKGVDFGTAADKAVIVAEVKNDLPPVDTALLPDSENPVQNKAVYAANEKNKTDIAGIRTAVYGGETVGKNKLDPNALTLNSFIDTDGAVKTQTNGNGSSVTAFIHISQHAAKVVTSYVNSLGAQSELSSNGYLCFYDDFHNRVGDRIRGGTAVIPHGAKFVRYSLANSAYTNAAERVMLEFSDQMTPFESYKKTSHEGFLKSSEHIIKQNTITVGVGKEYNSFVDAVNSITDSGYYNRYTIEVYDGVYNTIESKKIRDGYKGCIIPDWVSLVGIGDRNNIVLTAALSDAQYRDYAKNISTLNYMGNGKIENVTIKAKNIRYCVHDDHGTEQMVSAEHTYKYVKFIYESVDDAFANIGLAAMPIGIGAQTDKSVIFENCDFETHRGSYSILIHDNSASTQERGARLTVDSCNFINKTTSGTQCICLSNSGGNMESYANIKNSNLYKGIRFTSARADITANVWKLFATGNNNYHIAQTEGMTDTDLSKDIVAFNNAHLV